MTRLTPLALVNFLGACVLGLLCVAGGHGQGTAPAADVAKLVAMEAKDINAELAKPNFLKKGQKRVRAAAYMVAVYAQHAKDNGPAMATLRDQAIKLMRAAEQGKADEAKKLAPLIKADIAPDASAKAGPIALEKELDLESLMLIFSSEKVGGFGLEKALEDLAEAKTHDAAALAKTVALGLKVGMIGKAAQAYAPAKDEAKKTKKAWEDMAVELQTGAGELAAAAQSTKEAEIGKIAGKVTATCVKCHDLFR